MTPARLLRELTRRGVKLTINGDRLRYEAPPGTPTPELLEAMHRHKRELLHLLAGEARGLAPGARVRSLVPGYPRKGAVVGTGFRSAPHGRFAAVVLDDGLLAFVSEDYLEVVSG